MLLATATLAAALHLVPRPLRVERLPCPSFAPPRAVSPGFDSAARTELDERWGALGIGELSTVPAQRATIVVRRDSALPPQAYRLVLRGGKATIDSADADGAFYAAMTLAQLPQQSAGGWSVPCASIEDRPAMRWRILSDDVSRGPLPTMRYFEERIRTIAAFKMNGYSPYMEHVFVSPTDPLPAPLDGITPAELHRLDAYAARFHVALIPQQQSFAHMHNTLAVERYSAAAALPHGFLLAPNAPLSQSYLSRIVAQELDAVPHPPFFHIGSDETQTLGLGTTKAYVARVGLARAYADHIVAMHRLIAPSGARLMLWDDILEKHPEIMAMIPHDCIVVNWHYGDEKSFEPYIQRIAGGGFAQMIDPGTNNWNEIFPRVRRAVTVERRFIGEGKASRVLGLYLSDWHDDGETLYEATWYPALYAAADAWERGDVDPQRFQRDFSWAFFGSADPRYASDAVTLGDLPERLHTDGYEHSTDTLFWSDPFDSAAERRMSTVDLHAVRLDAERVEEDLYARRPPLHRNAAFVMFLAARRFDTLARKFQIASEVRSMYADAVAESRDPAQKSSVQRNLMWSKYWMWELRDRYEELAPLYARAWRYESREGHLAGNLERYHIMAQRAIRLSDAFARAMSDHYLVDGTLPAFDRVIQRSAPEERAFEGP